MPGIAIATGQRAHLALDAMMREGWRSTPILASESGIRAGATAPASYPLIAVNAEDAVAVLEGAVYGVGVDRVREALADFARAFSRDRTAARNTLERWAAEQSGDFVILVATHDGQRALVVNDRLGRLPLFWSRDGANAAVAREIKAVRAVCGSGQPDKSAIAQVLLFSFPLGTRTLHANIRRVPEASSVALDVSGDIDIRPYAAWNFQDLQADASAAPSAAELATLFNDACREQVAWAGERPIVLGLSGGLDSRAVAAALSRSGTRYATVTFTSSRKKAAEETQTSEQIARALDVPWEELRLAPPSWDDEVQMARMRDGTSNVALAFMFEYFDTLARSFGPDTVHFTGDGGDRALPDLRADVSIRSRDAFVEYRLAHALWEPRDAAALVGLPRERIVSDVREHFATYPETDPALHEVRFMIADWAMCRLFFGEDRNRSFMWGMTPFYHQRFFEAAMRAPQRRKRHYRLYADFLRALDPRVLRVAKSNWGYAVDSPLVRWNAWRDAIASAVLVRLKGRGGSGRRTGSGGSYGTVSHDPGFAALALRHQGSTFDAQRVRAITERGLDKLQYHMLATVLAYADAVWEGSAGKRLSVPAAVPER